MDVALFPVNDLFADSDSSDEHEPDEQYSEREFNGFPGKGFVWCVAGQPLVIREFAFHALNANLVWPGAQAFAFWLADRPHLFERKRVLELGSGTGALAIFLKSQFGCDITTSDYNDEEIESNIFYNFERNGFSPVPHIRHTWGDELPKEIPSFDLIIASDILLYVKQYPKLIQTLKSLLVKRSPIEGSFLKEILSEDSTLENSTLEKSILEKSTLEKGVQEKCILGNEVSFGVFPDGLSNGADIAILSEKIDQKWVLKSQEKSGFPNGNGTDSVHLQDSVSPQNPISFQNKVSPRDSVSPQKTKSSPPFSVSPIDPISSLQDSLSFENLKKIDLNSELEKGIVLNEATKQKELPLNSVDLEKKDICRTEVLGNAFKLRASNLEVLPFPCFLMSWKRRIPQEDEALFFKGCLSEGLKVKDLGSRVFCIWS